MTLTEKFYYRPVSQVIPLMSLLSNDFEIVIGMIVKLKLEISKYWFEIVTGHISPMSFKNINKNIKSSCLHYFLTPLILLCRLILAVSNYTNIIIANNLIPKCKLQFMNTANFLISLVLPPYSPKLSRNLLSSQHSKWRVLFLIILRSYCQKFVL